MTNRTPTPPAFRRTPWRALWLSLSAAILALTLSAGQARADFRGGGILFNFTPECVGWQIGSVDVFRARYRASEIFGDNPSALTIAFPSGSLQFAIWGPFTPGGPSGPFLGGSIRYMFTSFVFAGGGVNGPRARIIQRQITERIDPAGPATIQNAREVVLRLRLQNFDRIGCAVTAAATLRRRF